MLAIIIFWALLVIWVKYMLVFQNFRTNFVFFKTTYRIDSKIGYKQYKVTTVLYEFGFTSHELWSSGTSRWLLMLLIGELISKNMYFSPIFRLNLEIVFSNPCKPWKMMWTFLSWIKFWFHLLLCNYFYLYSCN